MTRWLAAFVLCLLPALAAAQQQNINLGVGPNTGTGDTISSAFTKTQHNDTQLYGMFGPGSCLMLTGLVCAGDLGLTLYPRTAAEVTASVTPTNYNWPPYDARRYGAVDDCSADAHTALQNAINAAQEAGTQQHPVPVTLEPGACYKLTTGLTFKQGKSSTDAHTYSPYLLGYNASLFPSPGITAITIVPRCLLSDQGTGRATAVIDIEDVIVDGGNSNTTGTAALLIGAATFTWRGFDWSKISHFTAQNFGATSTPTVHLTEGSHAVFYSLDVRSSASQGLLIDTHTASGFVGDFVFYTGEFSANTSSGRPIMIEASSCNACVARGVKFIATDVYGSGSYLHVNGSGGGNVQVGDVWFEGGMQFDQGSSTVPFLELFAEVSGIMFAIKSQGTYFDNASQAVYAHTDGTASTNDITLDSSHILQMTLANATGLGAIYCNAVNGMELLGNQFYLNVGTTGAAQITANNCTDLQIVGNSSTGSNTTIPYGILVSGSSSNHWVINGNQFDDATTQPVFYSSISGSAAYYDQLSNIWKTDFSTGILSATGNANEPALVLKMNSSSNPAFVVGESASGTGAMNIDASASAKFAGINFNTGLFGSESARWLCGKNATAESGSNVGSDFVCSAFNDAGSFLSTPFTITRSTGAATFSSSVSAGAGTFAPSSGNALTATALSGSVAGVFTATTSSNAVVVANAPASADSATIGYTTALGLRWNVGKDSTAESGSNAGSNWSVFAYSDVAGFLGTPMSITRSTGGIKFAAPYSGGGATVEMDGTQPIWVPNISSGAGTAYVCSSSGVFTTNSTACNPSSERFKQNLTPIPDALPEIMQLKTFNGQYRPEFNPEKQGDKLFFSAEQLASVDGRLVGYGKDHKPENALYSPVDVLLVKAMQEQQAQIVKLRRQLASLIRLQRPHKPAAPVKKAA